MLPDASAAADLRVFASDADAPPPPRLIRAAARCADFHHLAR
jgi:hypothetical protein